jgi:putative transposase
MLACCRKCGDNLGHDTSRPATQHTRHGHHFLCRLPILARRVSYAVWLYYRFPLSLRIVEELLAVRGIEITYETVRR